LQTSSEDIPDNPASAVRQSSVPLYTQIAEYLQTNFIARTGNKEIILPSEKKLAEKFCVHRGTVRKAIAALKKNGCVQSRRGQGTFTKVLAAAGKDRIDLILPPSSTDSVLNPVNYFLSIEILKGISAQCELYHSRLYIHDIPWEENVHIKILSLYEKNQSSAGILFIGYTGWERTISELTARNIRSVVINGLKSNTAVNSIGTDHEENICKAVAHLSGLGHKKIGYISGPLSSPVLQERFNGFVKAMRMEGIRTPEVLIAECGGLPDDGYKACGKLLQENPGITALCCATDYRALGAIRFCSEHNIHVPRDISITGYDGIAEGEHCTPPLTTIKTPLCEYGRQAVKMLIDTRHNSADECMRKTLPGVLITRQSSGPCRG